MTSEATAAAEAMREAAVNVCKEEMQGCLDIAAQSPGSREAERRLMERDGIKSVLHRLRKFPLPTPAPTMDREALRADILAIINNDGRFPVSYTRLADKIIDAILALAPPVPEGWVLVPREPTEAMVRATLPADDPTMEDLRFGERVVAGMSKLSPAKQRDGMIAAAEIVRDYRIMLAAAPQPGEG